MLNDNATVTVSLTLAATAAAVGPAMLVVLTHEERLQTSTERNERISENHVSDQPQLGQAFMHPGL